MFYPYNEMAWKQISKDEEGNLCKLNEPKWVTMFMENLSVYPSVLFKKSQNNCVLLHENGTFNTILRSVLYSTYWP